MVTKSTVRAQNIYLENDTLWFTGKIVWFFLSKDGGCFTITENSKTNYRVLASI